MGAGGQSFFHPHWTSPLGVMNCNLGNRKSPENRREGSNCLRGDHVKDFSMPAIFIQQDISPYTKQGDPKRARADLTLTRMW